MGFSIKCSFMTSRRISPTLGKLCSVIFVSKNILSRYPRIHCSQNRIGDKRWWQIQNHWCFWARRRGPKVRRQRANDHRQPMATPPDQRLYSRRFPSRKIHNQWPRDRCKIIPRALQKPPILDAHKPKFQCDSLDNCHIHFLNCPRFGVLKKIKFPHVKNTNPTNIPK